MNDHIELPKGTAINKGRGGVQLPILKCQSCDYTFGRASKADFRTTAGIVLTCPQCGKQSGFKNPYR